MNEEPFKFPRPADAHELDIARKRIELALETIRNVAKTRMMKMILNPLELEAYINRCTLCRGLCWTWHCGICKSSGGPPNQICEHLSEQEVIDVNLLAEEERFLDKVERDLGLRKIEVTDIEDPRLPDVVRNALKRPSKRPQG